MTTINSEYNLGGKYKFKIVEREDGGIFAEYEDGHVSPIIETENFGRVVGLDHNPRNSFNGHYVGRFTDIYKAILDGDAHFHLCSQLEHYENGKFENARKQDLFYDFIPALVFYCLDEEKAKMYKETCMAVVNTKVLDTISPKYALALYGDNNDTVAKMFYINDKFSIMLDKNDGRVLTFNSTEEAKTTVHSFARFIIGISKSLEKLYEDYPSESPQGLTSKSILNVTNARNHIDEVDDNFYKRLNDILNDCENNGQYDYPFIYAQADGRLKYFFDNPEATDKDWYRAFCKQFEVVEMPMLDDIGSIILHKTKENTEDE